MGKSKNTRIYDKFTYWSVADCDCKFCAFYRGKKRGCSFDECYCAEERDEVYRREQAALKAVKARKKARNVVCD
ncbi:hypothetical protein AGMMS49975_25370 [Clostridia bacterium]|nr:hypothetical protein AGMMS49975_25370 [Clostridia bacterium]